MTQLELDPQFTQGLRLLHSTNKDSAEQLRALLDEAIKQKYGPSKMLSNVLHKKVMHLIKYAYINYSWCNLFHLFLSTWWKNQYWAITVVVAVRKAKAPARLSILANRARIAPLLICQHATHHRTFCRRMILWHWKF